MRNYSIQQGTRLLLKVFLCLFLYTHLPVKADDKRNDHTTDFLDSLVLVDEPVSQVLSLIEQLTGKTVILPSQLPNVKINLNIPLQITKEEALIGLKSVLSANGIALSSMGEKFLKVAPTNRAKSYSPDLIEGDSIQNLTPSQEIYSHIFNLTNLTAREASRIAYSSLTPGVSAVVVLDKANALLITDTLTNLQRIDALFKRIDQVGQVKEEVLFFELKNVTASELKKQLEKLQHGGLKRYLSGNTSFEADDRTNQLMVITPPGNGFLVRRFIESLDINVTPLTRSEVFRIKHGTGKEMTELIKKLVQQQQANANKNKPEATAAEAQKLASGGEQNAQFSRHLSIEADERSNAVVVYGTSTDIQQIGQLISQLDVILPQVRIEVIIAEVRLTKGQVSGLENFGYKYGLTDANDKIQRDIVTTGTATTAFALNALHLKKLGLDFVLNKAKNDDNISIVSSPTLLTTHNREASIRMGESRPYLSHTVSKVADGRADPATTSSEIKQEEAGIELKVKPLIGLNGVVQLDITQVIDDFSTKTATAPGTSMELPYIVKRKIQSFVTVKSDEVIVLAGLKQRDFKHNENKIFLLGSLPILGDNLFTSKHREEVVKELVVFIRPHVLTDIVTVQKDSEDVINKLTDTNRTNVQNYTEKGKFEDPKHSEEDLHKANRKKEEASEKRKPHQPRSKKSDDRPVIQKRKRFSKTPEAVPPSQTSEVASSPSPQEPPSLRRENRSNSSQDKGKKDRKDKIKKDKIKKDKNKKDKNKDKKNKKNKGKKNKKDKKALVENKRTHRIRSEKPKDHIRSKKSKPRSVKRQKSLSKKSVKKSSQVTPKVSRPRSVASKTKSSPSASRPKPSPRQKASSRFSSQKNRETSVKKRNPRRIRLKKSEDRPVIQKRKRFSKTPKDFFPTASDLTQSTPRIVPLKNNP